MNDIDHYDVPDIISKRKLNNQHFSIICSNCVGVIFYHRFKMRFESPTINLQIMGDDFVDFCAHLKEYLASDDLSEDKNASESYPVGILTRKGGHHIRIHFVHYPSFQKGKDKWNERKQRVDYDNLYFIMMDVDGPSKKTIQKFDALPLKHKVVLTGKNYPDIKSAFWIKGCSINGHLDERLWYRPGNYLNKPNFEQFDFVKFFNSK